MKPNKSKWQWGKSPDPSNWQEASDALESLKPPKRSSLYDKLEAIEKALKDRDK